MPYGTNDPYINPMSRLAARGLPPPFPRRMQQPQQQITTGDGSVMPGTQQMQGPQAPYSSGFAQMPTTGFSVNQASFNQPTFGPQLQQVGGQVAGQQPRAGFTSPTSRFVRQRLAY